MRFLFSCNLVLTAVLAVGAPSDVVVACQPGLEVYYPLVRAVYERMGLRCVFVEMPSERAMVEVNSGHVDAEIGRTANLVAQYPNIVYTHEPLIVTGLSGWVRSGSSGDFKSAQTLGASAIGLLRGNKSSEAFVTEKGLDGQRFSNLESLSQMLKAGRIQVAIVPDATDSTLFETFGMKVDIGAPKYPVYHIFAKQRKDWADLWDQALRGMKAEGAYSQYLR